MELSVFWGEMWRSFVRPLLWHGAKAMGSEALVRGRNIITDMAWNTDPNAKIRDIVRRIVTESAHRVINRLGSQGRKRKSAAFAKRGKIKKAKKQPATGKAKKNIRNGISSRNRFQSLPDHGSLII